MDLVILSADVCCSVPEENVATPKRGARVISGDMRSALLDGDTETYDMERGYTRHTINDAPDNPGIIVRLATSTIINNIRLLLWDRDNRYVPLTNYTFSSNMQLFKLCR